MNDQIGRSSKFLVTIFLIKVAQICGNFLGYFKKISQSLVKLLYAHRLGKLWQLFIITTSFKKLEHPNYYTLALNVIFQTFGTFFGATLSSISALENVKHIKTLGICKVDKVRLQHLAKVSTNFVGWHAAWAASTDVTSHL